MGTTSEKLEYLSNTKGLIKTSIENSGVEVSDTTTFREYPDKIDSILGQFSDELDTIIGGELSPSEPGKTITPTTTEQIAISQGVLAGGDIKVAGDVNLISDNIAKDVSIFGVTGTHEGGIILPTLTTPADTSDIRVNKQTIDSNGSIITGTLPEVEIATPSITVSSSGLITASATQSGGIVTAGSKSATQQLPTQGAKTVTPTTTQQTVVSSGRYTTGNIYVAGDSNLIADNIKMGVNIFGVEGTWDNYYTIAVNGNDGTFLGIETLELAGQNIEYYVFTMPMLAEWGIYNKTHALGVSGAIKNHNNVPIARFTLTGLNVNSQYPGHLLGSVCELITKRYGSGVGICNYKADNSKLYIDKAFLTNISESNIASILYLTSSFVTCVREY